MKIQVKNISYKEYLELKDRTETNFYLSHADFLPIDIFGIGSFFDAEFGFVKDMQENFNDSFLTWDEYLKEISEYKNIPMIQLGKYSIYEIKQSINFCQSEIEKINKLESDNLGHVSESDEISAGIEVFNKYRSFIQFDSLTNGDLTKIDLIRKLSYSVCFTKLMLDADNVQYHNNLIKIRNK